MQQQKTPAHLLVARDAVVDRDISKSRKQKKQQQLLLKKSGTHLLVARDPVVDVSILLHAHKCHGREGAPLRRAGMEGRGEA